jgi:double-strand break repair protein MRE11
MVLIAGDLFHDNKPSRRTLHKTMDIIRRYTMGPNAVKIQILSDQAKNFRSNQRVNYEDEFYSVGTKQTWLPVKFEIFVSNARLLF